MCRYKSVILTAASITLLATDLFPQSGVGVDSTLTPDRIESTIAFLEDTQKVAELTRRLRRLAEAQKATGAVTDDNAPATAPKSVFNLLLAGKKAADGWGGGFKEAVSELRLLIDRVQKAKSELRGRFLLEWAVSLLVMLLLAAAVGGVVSFSLWRTGRRMRGSFTADATGSKRMQGLFSIVLTRSAFGVGGAFTLFIISLLPTAGTMQRFFSSIAAGYILYIAAVTLLAALLSPNLPRLRTSPCSDIAARQITGRLRTLLRASLFMYLLYRTAAALELPVTSRFIVLAYQMLLTVMLPVALYRLRPRYLEPYRKLYDGRKKIPPVTQTVDFVLSKLYLIVFLYGIVLLGIALAGTPATYRYFIRGTTATSIVLIAGGFFVGLWHGAMHRLTGSSASFLSRYPELQGRISGNIRIVGIIGYGIIASIVMFFLVKMWGMPIEDLLKSKSPVVQASLRIAAIAAGVWVLLQVAYFIISRFQHTAQSRMSAAEGANIIEIEKRVSTLGDIFRKILSISILVVGVIMVLDELGFDVKAMIAGLGIAGIAVGFGAQNLVRDVISGLFVIFENRIRVGDVAIVNGTGGLVENVNLRTTVLRGLNGTIHVFPNGEISSLSNMTHEFSFYVFDIGVAYREDTDRVSQVLKQLGEEIRNDAEFRDAILEPLEILGVDAFADSAVIIKARIKTVPIKQWFVGREMNRRIKKRFDELGIEIPFPHRTLYFGDAGKPFALQTDDASLQREEIKKLLREVLEEQRGKW